MGAKPTITVQTNINAPLQKVWDYWTSPQHITQWNHASADWHTTLAENDLQIGGKFMSRMEAKDGSMGFDFSGIYNDVILHKKISYTLDDGRKVTIDFAVLDDASKIVSDATTVIETFEAEDENSLELQQTGWQAILDNFKQYAEKN
jgi:uncharacterized protein YndB with AHSA1/START domain